MHSWDVTPGEALRIQEELRRRVSLERCFNHIVTVAGADVSFFENEVAAVVVVFEYETMKVVDEAVVTSPCSFPYIPGLLTFREGPVLLQAFAKVTRTPDVILFDGQGIAHPRGVGIASHLGVLLERATIGCAKSRLVGEYTEPLRERGSVSALTLDRMTVGAVVRTRTGVKPIFVSPGHLMDLTTAIEIVLNCCTRYRLPEPIRWAHTRAKKTLRA
jgi:deoxyribonuclease V